MKIKDIFKLVISIVISESAGVIGSFFTIPAISDWYVGLVKPALNPPAWVFGPVWIALYFLIGVSLFLVWKNDWKTINPILENKRKAWNVLSERLWTGNLQKANVIAIFIVQYILNILWSFIFFGLHLPCLAFFEILALWFAIVFTIFNFYRISKLSAYLLLPYIFWVSFAGYLNFSIWQINPAIGQEQPAAIFCTQEAKLCSDGSYVSRTWLNCEFEPCQKEDLIIVESPKPYNEISSPIILRGKARGNWYFEASFPVKLFDDNGFLLGIVPATAQDEWMTENFVPFEAKMNFAVPSTKNGVIIFEKDNPSGLAEYDDELKVPIIFKETQFVSNETMNVKIFLSDSKYVNEPYFDCSKTAVVEREVPKVSAVAKAAIESLLRGATKSENEAGFYSSIPVGVRLNRITIENSVAKIDFNEQLEYQVGGSCRVAAIKTQIEETLKQFSTVKNVKISINGIMEDILQP